MERPDPSLARATALIRRSGTARARDLEAAGVARAQLTRLVDRGALVRLARGLYALPGGPSPADEGLLIVARRVPSARLCLLTALRLHGLTTQTPSEVWIAIGNKDRAPRLDWPPLRVLRFSGEALDAGLETRQFGGASLRVTNVAKTVADCFKFRTLVGLDVAVEALREALLRRAASHGEIMQFAKVCRVTRVMRPYLEALQ